MFGEVCLLPPKNNVNHFLGCLFLVIFFYPRCAICWCSDHWMNGDGLRKSSPLKIANRFETVVIFSSVQFSRSVVSDSLWPHESQHTRPPRPSPTPGVHSDSRCAITLFISNWMFLFGVYRVFSTSWRLVNLYSSCFLAFEFMMGTSWVSGTFIITSLLWDYLKRSLFPFPIE